MSEYGFLTDTSKKILAGTYEGSDAARYSARYRLRQNARAALLDLIYIARSDDVIDPEDVFPPALVAEFIESLMSPTGGMVPLWNFDGSLGEHNEAYQYQHDLHSRLSPKLGDFGQMIFNERVHGKEYASALEDAHQPKTGPVEDEVSLFE